MKKATAILALVSILCVIGCEKPSMDVELEFNTRSADRQKVKRPGSQAISKFEIDNKVLSSKYEVRNEEW